jgi:hypothetical protein
MNKKEQKEAAETLFVAIEAVTTRVVEDRLEDVTERLAALEPEEDEEELVTVGAFDEEVTSIKERLDSLEAGDDEEEEDQVPASDVRDALISSLQNAESFDDFRKDGLKLLQKL